MRPDEAVLVSRVVKGWTGRRAGQPQQDDQGDVLTPGLGDVRTMRAKIATAI